MWMFSLLFGITLLQRISCQCAFPATLTGTWVSSNDGTWDINSTHLLNFYTLSSTTGNTIASGVSQLDFTCYENQGDTKYAIKSEEFNLFGSQRSVYTCIDIREISENKLLYYHATEADPSGLQFTIQSVYANICNMASYELPYNYHIALKSGTETTALQNCPSTMFGSYNYDTCIDVNSNGTSLDVCDSRQQLIFNYTLCNTPQMYTLEGVLDCVYHVDSGSISYLTLYNRDSTTPDNSNYYQYVCLAVELSGSTVFVTARPNRCNDNQNATAIGTPGQALQLTPYYLCPITTDESSSLDIVPIIVGVVVALVLLALIALIIYCCCTRKCRKKKPDVEEAKSDSEDEEEQKKSESRSESRRSSKSSLEEEEEKKSIDSGISEPPVTARTDSNIEDAEGDANDQEKELVITAEGDKETEDKNSRPCSGQRSRMSDLPPSTIPPDEDQPLSQRSEEDQINDEIKVENDEDDEQEDTIPEQSDDREVSVKNDDSDHEQEIAEQIDDSEHNDEEVKSEANESEPEATDEAEKEQEILEDDKEVEGEKEESEAEEESQEEDEQDEVQEEQEPEKVKVDNTPEEAHQDNEPEEVKEDNEPEDVHTENEPEDDVQEDKGEENNEIFREEEEKQEGDAEPEAVPESAESKDENQEDQNQEEHQSDLEITVDTKDEAAPEDPDGNDTKPEDHEQTKEDEEQESQKESDTEEQVITRKDKTVSSDEDEILRKVIGGKKDKEYLTKGALTTVLVSREEEERQRQKLNSKTKTQKMRKMAKKKTRRFGGKGVKSHRYKVDGDELWSSDEEIRRRGPREAPFMKQYEDKKHIEHILEEQHYWSDPEADKDAFRLNDDMSSIFRSDYSSESEEEVIGIDADGIPIRVKKTKRDKRKKRGDGDDISNADSEYLRQKMLKRAGSVDSMVSVEDPDNIDQRKSKRRLNEHIMKTDSDEEVTAHKTRITTSERQEYEGADDDRKPATDDQIKTDGSANAKFSSNKTRTIIVNEHSDMKVGLTDGDNYITKKGKRTLTGKESDDFSDFCDSDIDKLSDRDSGMDEECDIDVLLTPDQQQMIVTMLFDEEMNLRPQFDRDEHGRIVRRLDNTVVYDPHTGRFTYRKRLGQIFKVPRLKRNDKGRPLGGYIDDEFGPKSDQVTLQRKTSSSARRSQSGKSGRLSVNTRSPSVDLKRTRTDGKNVGFSVPDEDIDSIPGDELEYNKRGRRDIGSAIRRKLNKRLFRKKRKHLGKGSASILPEVQVKKAWADDQHFVSGTGSASGAGGVSPLTPRNGRFAHSSPWPQRKTPGPGDAEQWQMYREGLQSDRKILENLQDKLNTREGTFAPREAFVEQGGEGDQADQGQGQYAYDRGYSYLTDDGRIGIRERGCPELKRQKTPLFTIIRRPGDLESQEHLDGVNDGLASERHSNSAPLHVQDYNEEQPENEQNEGHRYTSDNSLVARSHDGRYSQMTSIDDNRLRRLLEELYKDKKYFDNYVESRDPKSDEFVHSQGLAEHGRGYLLRRADFWERRGPLPPRPPMTAIGWKMQRQQTFLTSRQGSELGISTATCTPDLSATNMPGVVESPRNGPVNKENDSRNTPSESYA